MRSGNISLIELASVSYLQSATCVLLIAIPLYIASVRDPRPVVLLGALEVDVRRYLVDHGSTTDIKFSYCKRGVCVCVCVCVMEVEGEQWVCTTLFLPELSNGGT